MFVSFMQHDERHMWNTNCFPFWGEWVPLRFSEIVVVQSLIVCVVFCRSLSFYSFSLTIVLCVLFRFMASHYPFGIFKFSFMALGYNHWFYTMTTVCMYFNGVSFWKKKLKANYNYVIILHADICIFICIWIITLQRVIKYVSQITNYYTGYDSISNCLININDRLSNRYEMTHWNTGICN